MRARITVLLSVGVFGQAGVEADDVAGVLRLHNTAGRFLMSGDWSTYERLRTDGLKQPWAKIAKGYPGSRSARTTPYTTAEAADTAPSHRRDRPRFMSSWLANKVLALGKTHGYFEGR